MKRHEYISTLFSLGIGARLQSPTDAAVRGWDAPTTNVDPFTCFADGEEDDEDDDGDGGATFTQADVDRIVKQRLRKKDKELAKLTSRLEETDSTIAELREQMEAAQQGGGGDEDAPDPKEVARMKRELAKLSATVEQLTSERDEFKGQAEAATSSFRSHLVRSRAQQALVEAGVLPKAIDDALRSFTEGAEFDEGDDGNPVVVFKVGDVPFEDPAKAAQKFLAERSHFARANTGGGSGPSRGGSPTAPKVDVETNTTAGLDAALRTPSSGKQGADVKGAPQ